MYNKILFLFVIIFAVTSLFDNSYAEEKIEVSIPKGTSTLGCEVSDLCYIPSPITIKVGDVIQWINHDSSIHTVTSGSPTDGPDGIIYSDLMDPGEVFAFSFDEPGVFAYYCTLHPWMQGLVTVEVSKDKQPPTNVFDLTETKITSDGSTIITIQTDRPQAGNILQIELMFTNDENLLLDHMNYDIRVTQDGEEVLLLENAHVMDGTIEHNTRTLESDNPIDVEIGIRGIYLQTESQQEIEETIEFQAIPEFGTIAMLILVVSISAIIALRAKSSMILEKI